MIYSKFIEKYVNLKIRCFVNKTTDFLHVEYFCNLMKSRVFT